MEEYMSQTHESTQTDFSCLLPSDLLEEITEAASQDGTDVQTFMTKAARLYLASRKNGNPRNKVLEALAESMNEHDELYRALAK